MTLAAPAQVRPVADSTASGGEPIGATTMGPRVSIPETWASLGAVNVTTASAR